MFYLTIHSTHFIYGDNSDNDRKPTFATSLNNFIKTKDHIHDFSVSIELLSAYTIAKSVSSE